MTLSIIDTDIGTDVDDALALALATRSPTIQLVGVTTVHANATLRSRVAQRLLQLAGRDDLPVVAGRSAPLRRSSVDDFHWNELWGHEGAGLLSDAERDVVEDNRQSDAAAEFLVEQVRRYPREISLVTLGALSNVARAMQIDPDFARNIGHITTMGGLVHRGEFEWPAHFETNLNADPEAAEIVLRSGAPITLVPLEVTLQVYLTSTQRTEMAATGNPLAAALLALIEHMREPFLAFNDRYGLDGSDFDERTYMHDPLAVYASFGTDLIDTRPARIDVCYEGQTLRTIERDGDPNMTLCYGADGARFPVWWMQRILSAMLTVRTNARRIQTQ